MANRWTRRLHRLRRRIAFERVVSLSLLLLMLPSLLFAALWVQVRFRSLPLTAVTVVVVFLASAWGRLRLVRFCTRPLNTLSNVVASLRMDDFSLRARGAQRGDALGDLALEINLLAGTLQQQRTAVLDALALVERVLSAMPSPVLAFDTLGSLRLLNDAASKVFSIEQKAVGSAASALNLLGLLTIADQSVFSAPSTGTRWSVRRTMFRLQGVPHTLFVLTDVAAALREEERVAWQRLVRVLSHEINNSLAPIQSIAGSLRTREQRQTDREPDTQVLRGLSVIEERAASLHRFLGNYQQVARLPKPSMCAVDLREVLRRVVCLETRVVPELQDGPPRMVLCDPDQLEQALINLLRNAADAALQPTGRLPEVCVTLRATPEMVMVEISDNGMGLANAANLFVPFYTTKPEGSGIGLVLARQIATVHEGSLTLRDRDDGPGCVATFSLPLAPAMRGELR